RWLRSSQRDDRGAVACPAARGETPAAFGRRCIPAPPHRAGKRAVGAPGLTALLLPHIFPICSVVAPLRRGPHGADCAPWGGSAGRLAALGATLDFHHGLLTPQHGKTRNEEHDREHEGTKKSQTALDVH